MRQASATEVKNRFGEYLDSIRDEPLAISKTGKVMAVLLSSKEYERLVSLEDKYWADLAQDAELDETVGHEESMRFLLRKINAPS